MPRRIPDYPDAFSIWNYVSSFGSIISVTATILFGYIIYDLFANGKDVNSNPWAVPGYYEDLINFEDGTQASNSLEWTLGTPTPFHAYNMLPLHA